MTSWQVNSKVSLITNSNIRYEGILVQIKSQDQRLLLKDVKSFGTEGRNKGVNEVPTPAADDPTNFYSLVEFQIPMIKELYIIEPPPGPVPSDPAIVSVSQTEAKEGETEIKNDDEVKEENEDVKVSDDHNDMFDNHSDTQTTEHRYRRGRGRGYRHDRGTN